MTNASTPHASSDSPSARWTRWFLGLGALVLALGFVSRGSFGGGPRPPSEQQRARCQALLTALRPVPDLIDQSLAGDSPDIEALDRALGAALARVDTLADAYMFSPDGAYSYPYTGDPLSRSAMNVSSARGDALDLLDLDGYTGQEALDARGARSRMTRSLLYAGAEIRLDLAIADSTDFCATR